MKDFAKQANFHKFSCLRMRHDLKRAVFLAAIEKENKHIDIIKSLLITCNLQTEFNI